MDVHPGTSQRDDQGVEASVPRASLSPFRVPAPYGEAAGADSVSSVAAPLLTAGAIALAGVVIQEDAALRYPGVVLSFLTIAMLLLVTSVQCGAWARRYAAAPGEMLQWWPNANQARIDALAEEQRLYSARHAVWAWGCSLSFNSGIVVLWAAFATALIPDGDSRQQAWRWVATIIAVLGMLIEVLWTVLSSSASHRRRRRYLSTR